MTCALAWPAIGRFVTLTLTFHFAMFACDWHIPDLLHTVVSLYVHGVVAQTHSGKRPFAWPAWHSWYCGGSACWPGLGACDLPRHVYRGAWLWHNLTGPPSVSRGRLCAQTHIKRRFAWQGMAQFWHWVAPTWARGLGHACDAAPLCVAGVAQPDMAPSFHVLAEMRGTKS